MGRQVRRVPLDFEWPIDKVWDGFLNPHYKKCETCGGSGETAAAQQLDALVRLVMLAGSDAARARRFHPYFDRTPLGGETPAPALAEVTRGLSGREGMPGVFHDCCDNYSARKKILLAAGLPDTWGACAACEGHGVDPTTRAAYDAWEPTDPPVGDGWQMWETVSEGSPISPVFSTPDELAAWLSVHNRGVDMGTTESQWLKFITGPGWAVSLIIDAHGVRTGVQL